MGMLYNTKNFCACCGLLCAQTQERCRCRRVGAWVEVSPKKENKMKNLIIIALALSMAGPALAQTNSGGSDTTGSTATGLTATGSGSGMHNAGSGMNGNGMNNAGINNNGGTAMKNGTGMNSSDRMNPTGSTSQD